MAARAARFAAVAAAPSGGGIVKTQSNVSPLRRPAQSRAGEADYDVVLPVVRWTGQAEATLRSLQEHLGRPEALQVVESAGAREQAAAGGVLPAEEERELTDVEGAWELALEYLCQHPERDLLVVVPGILAAPLLDLRLQWSAYAADEAALVSPLCDLDPVTSLARHGVRELTAAEIDDRIAGGGPEPVVDAPY